MNEIQRSDETPYWKTFGTVLWSFVIFVILAISQFIGLDYALTKEMGRPLPVEEVAKLIVSMGNDGNLLIWASLIGTAVTIPTILLIIKFKSGARIKEYLALNHTSLMVYFKWIAIMAVAVILSDEFLVPALGDNSADLFMGEMINSADSRFLLYIAVAVCAPILEELYFRGFLHKALAEGPLRPMGAIFLTSALWAVIHTQYEWYSVFAIFVSGIILGLARWKTNSIYVPIAMHAINNFAATALYSLG